MLKPGVVQPLLPQSPDLPTIANMSNLESQTSHPYFPMDQTENRIWASVEMQKSQVFEQDSPTAAFDL